MTTYIFAHRKTGRILKVPSTITMIELHHKGIHLSEYQHVGKKTTKS
jgi:hypothetical protein